MVEQIAGGGLSSSYILIAGVCVLVVTPLVWLVIMLTCGFRERESHADGQPSGPTHKPDAQASSKELALLIVAALQQNDIVQKDRFNDAVRIAVDRIQLRKALEGV